MYRPFAFSLLFLASGALVLAGQKLGNSVVETRGFAAAPATEKVSPPQMVTGEQAKDNRAFPPIFGTPAPKAAEPKVDELQRLRENFKYVLKGVIVSADTRWAVLGGPAGDVLLREGDEIGAASLAGIHNDRVDVDLGAGLISLQFDTTARLDVSPINTLLTTTAKSGFEAAAELWGSGTPMVMYQGVSAEEMARVLDRAEQRRRSMGWIQ